MGKSMVNSAINVDAVQILTAQIGRHEAEKAESEGTIERHQQRLALIHAKIAALRDAIDQIQKSIPEADEPSTNLVIDLTEETELDGIPKSPTAAIIAYLNMCARDAGMVVAVPGKDITDKLENWIETESNNRRHILRTTLHQLAKAGKITGDANGKYWIQSTNRNGRH
jgi:hypothetical protein